MVTLDPNRLEQHPFADRMQECAADQASLYALCCGAGADSDLRLVTEAEQRVIPSFGQNLCFDDSWMAATGVDLTRVVHGGLDLRMHRPFVPGRRLVARPRIAGLTDKGAGRPALILLQTDLLDGDEVVFTSLSSLFVMKGGGFGGDRGAAFEMIRTPEAAPEVTATLPTRPDSPLFFRLLGDRNPLHVVPAVARAAGFERPIMHGANTFGILCHDVLTRFCDGDPARMTRFAARFSGPLYPGETLAVSYWRDGDRILFAARATGRDAPVLDGGLAEIAAP